MAAATCRWGRRYFYMQKKKSIRIFGNVKTLCIAATLTAVTVVIAYLCKFLTITPNIRLTFENLPIIFAGFVFGPWIGLSVGLCADLISSLIFYGAGGINPLITLGAGCVGLFAGMMSKILPQKQEILRLGTSVAIAHIIGNMIIKSAALMIWYGTPVIGVLPRIPLYTVIAVIEFCMLLPIVKSGAVKRMITK